MKSKLWIVVCVMFVATSSLFGVAFSDYASSSGISNGVYYIDASGENITSLYGLSNNYPNLNQLDLSQNPISIIGSNDFYGLNKIGYLYLQYGSISQIAPGAFDCQNKLFHLNLSHNILKNVSSNIFDGLFGLETLYMSDSSVENLPSGLFKNNRSLKYLDLDNNNIHNLCLDGADFSILQQFRIENNPIESVSLNGAIINQRSFAVLMGDYKYSIVPGLSSESNLSSLSFNDVDFSNVGDFSYMYPMDSLERLYLRNATNLSGETLCDLIDNLENLSYLDITGSTWGNFSDYSKDLLSDWGNCSGHSLVVDSMSGTSAMIIPEPLTISLLSTGLLVVAKRKKR